MSLQGKLYLQASRAQFIELLKMECTTPSFLDHGVPVFQTKLDLLELNFKKLEDSHEKLLNAKDPTEVLESDYIKNKIFDTALANYSSIRSLLVPLIMAADQNADVFHDSLRRPSHNETITRPARRKLPEIALPNFTGDYTAWDSFKDLFSSMVGSNQELSNVEKMHYLRTSLTEEPLTLIANLTLTEAAFDNAWQLLKARYDNKRMIISAHLDKLLNPPAMKSHSAKELNLILSQVAEAMNGLAASGSPVDQWDQVLVHVISQKLSSKLREAWELKVGASSEYPVFSELKNFLTGRARAMESIELNALPPVTNPAKYPSRPSHARVHTVTSSSHSYAERSAQQGPAQSKGTAKPNSQSVSSPSWADSSRYPCSYCSGDHFIVSCPGFRQLTPVGRKQVVVEKYLCFNCLGKHSLKVCQSTKSCMTCRQRHHTMIHVDAPRYQSQSPAQRHQIAQSSAQQVVSQVVAQDSSQRPQVTEQSNAQT